MRLPDALRRAFRTFAQDFIRTFLLLVTLPNVVQNAAAEGNNVAASVPAPSVIWSALIAAAWAGILAVLVWAQNALEDNGSIPALLKAPASEGENPVPDPPAGEKSPATRPRKKPAK